MSLLKKLFSKKQLPQWITGESTTVFAFKAFTSEAAAFALFSNMVILSSENLEARIRREVQCPDAQVIVLEPTEWNAPQIASLSQSSIIDAFPVVLARACETLNKRFGIKCTPQSLITMGAGAMTHPTGYVLFLFKIPGRPSALSE